MPLVKVEMRKGKSAEYKNALLDGIHKALVDCFKVAEDNRIQRLYELEEENFRLNASKTSDFVLIELTVFKGRSFDAKQNLYKAIVNNLVGTLGIAKTDIIIVLNEVPMENWGIRGGIPASQVTLGFEGNV